MVGVLSCAYHAVYKGIIPCIVCDMMPSGAVLSMSLGASMRNGWDTLVDFRIL